MRKLQERHSSREASWGWEGVRALGWYGKVFDDGWQRLSACLMSGEDVMKRRGSGDLWKECEAVQIRYIGIEPAILHICCISGISDVKQATLQLDSTLARS